MAHKRPQKWPKSPKIWSLGTLERPVLISGIDFRVIQKSIEAILKTLIFQRFLASKRLKLDQKLENRHFDRIKWHFLEFQNSCFQQWVWFRTPSLVKLFHFRSFPNVIWDFWKFLHLGPFWAIWIWKSAIFENIPPYFQKFQFWVVWADVCSTNSNFAVITSHII